MEYSSTKRQRLPGISFMMDDSDSCSSDDEAINNSENNNISYSLHRRGSNNDITMSSDTNHHHVHYHRCNSHVDSPLFTNDCSDTPNNNNNTSESDATMESPINAMTSYSSAVLVHSATKPDTTEQSAPPPAAAEVVPSPFFSPTTNTLNQSLIQHAESLVDETTDTPLERVENGVLDVMDRLGLAFSSVRKRTLLGELKEEQQCDTTDGLRSESGGVEVEKGEETIVLDVAAAYMARLARDGLYDDAEEEEEEEDYDNNYELDHSSALRHEEEEEDAVRVRGGECMVGKEENATAIPHSPPLIPVQEEEEEEELDDGDSIHDKDTSSSSISHDQSNLSSFQDSCYHEDGNNHNIDDSYDDDDEEDLQNDSYYICNTAGFCSSESVNESSISEPASEEEDEYEAEVEKQVGGFHEQEVQDDTNDEDNKSCSLDLTGIEQIMNLDDSLPSVIPKRQLSQSNSDVDLSGIEEVMNLDDTLPLGGDCDGDGTEEDATNGIGSLVNDGDRCVVGPSLIDDNDGVCSNDDIVVPSLNGVDSSMHDDKMNNDDDIAPSNADTVLQDEPSPSDNEESNDDDDFVPSALKEMISQQESQISSLLGSISNMQSTPGRIKKKLEASLMGDEDDEDAGLNGIVDMTNIEIGLTPVKRRLELVAEEELEIESEGRARMKQNSVRKSGLEPELELAESELQESKPTTLPRDHPESESKDEAAPLQQPSMELEVDGEQEDVIASSQIATESSSVIAADSSEVSCKSPWLSFISRQSPLSQPKETVLSQPDVHEEDAQVRIVQELPSKLTSSHDSVSEPTQEAETLDTSTEQVIPTDTSNSAAEDVPDSILQMFADAENVFENAMDSSMLNEKEASDSSVDNVDNLELREGDVFDDAVDELGSLCDSEMLEEPTKCNEVEINGSDLLEEKQLTGAQDSITSVEEKEVESVDHSTSSGVIGSAMKMNSDFPLPEPTGEEPTLECLRGAFLAAESKLDAESKVPASVAPKSHDATEEDQELIVDSIASDNKSDSSSIVNDTFETANFSLGDIEKAANDHLFFDAEDDMKSADGESSVQAAINLDTKAEEEGRMSSEFDNTTLPSENIKLSEGNFAVEDFVEPDGYVNHVDKLDDSIENAPTTSVLVNYSADKIQANVVVTGSSPTNSHNTKLSPGNSDVSVLNESMFMPNSSPEEVTPPPIAEEELPSAVADTHGTTTEEEYESEEGDDDEDFFPNRDLRSSSNAPRESVHTATNSSAADKSSLPRKHAAMNQITSAEKESTSRLPKLPNRMHTGSTSAASSKHRNRQSTTATSLKPSPISQTNATSVSSTGVVIQRQEDSASQTRPPRARIRAKKNAPPMDGKENNKSERTSKDNSSVASKKSIYSVERLERLSKPLRQSMIPEPSPVKQCGAKKVASIDRLRRLSQPRRQSVVSTNSPTGPVQRRATQNISERTSQDDASIASKKSVYSVERLERLSKPRRQSMIPKPSPVKQRGFKKVASIDHLRRLSQPRRQSVVPTNSPTSPVQKRAPQKASLDRLKQLAQPKQQPLISELSPSPVKKERQTVAAGTPSFVRRSKLTSSLRPSIKSTEEMEQEEMSQFKPFKAKLLNGKEVPSRFKALDRKPPRINAALSASELKPRPPVAVMPPSSRLYQPSPRRHKVLTFGESQQYYLNNGLRSQPPLTNSSTKLTTPKPFALSTRTNIMSREHPASSDEIELQKKFKAKPCPFPRRHTMSFSQPKSSEELELEECTKQFKALPMPTSVSATRINYSSTPYHIKAQQQYEIAMERKQRMAEESQETTSFKARPVPRSTYEARKVTRQSTSGVARTAAFRPPRLSLSTRAEERKLFDEHAKELREKDAQMKQDLLRQQQEWYDEELKQKRVTSSDEGGLCFKAREIHIEYM